MGPGQGVRQCQEAWRRLPRGGDGVGDPLSLTIPDPNHSKGEARFLLVGLTSDRRLVVVAHLEERDSIHIISARLATRTERRDYEEDPSR